MIRQLTGTVIDIHNTYITLDVNGVGYYIYMCGPLPASNASPTRLFTYLAVRETALDLYGFWDKRSLELFEKLLTLPKVGPKSAGQIMQQATYELLAEAAQKQDASYLAKLSGIGKKTAETITLGLKDYFGSIPLNDDINQVGQSTLQHEVTDALIALGYPPLTARDLAKTIPEDITDVAAAITAALKK